MRLWIRIKMIQTSATSHIHRNLADRRAVVRNSYRYKMPDEILDLDGRTAAPSFSVVVDRSSGGASQPVTWGVPFARGTWRGQSSLVLRNPDGWHTPVQAVATALWPDGSIKWLLVDAILPPNTPTGVGWRLEPGPEGPRGLMRVCEQGLKIAIETGAACFCLGRGPGLLERGQVGGRDVVVPGSIRTILTDARGREGGPRFNGAVVESQGPVRATVRLDGQFRGRAPCRFTVRLCFFAGTGLVRFRLTLHNPRRARHPGGIWDLGDPGSVLFRDLSLVLGLDGTGDRRVTWTAEPNQLTQSLVDGALEIYQDSSGGENWRSRNHFNREGWIPVSYCGYRVRAAGSEQSGLRASPTVELQGESGRVAAAIPEFWQQFPKALEVEDRNLRVRLFPGQFGDYFELQGGERKTHTLWLEFGPADAPDDSPLAWVHRPARIRATPEWYAASDALPYLEPASDRPGGRLDGELAAVVAGPRSFFARREVIDEYGWRNFGEVYADHEAAHYVGQTPIISHYNNQYDLVYGMILQYCRTGDGRWFDLLDPLARHVVDIDIYHTDQDRAAYSGGLFWHTDHYRDAATCTHRAYSRANRIPGRPYGGGPCAEHNYTTGLLHYYYLTGDEDARASVLCLADWVIALDDGRRNGLNRIDSGPTGWASCTTEPSYHGPGRGAGNSINTLLDGWLLTGHQAYLDKAEELIRRVIHPADDIDARQLLDTERRWSYTVFLSVLARYLDLKADAGELDFMYAYARASLLHYAGWMLEHELPYFDRPEALEYPTEAWASQEFRKANVLRLAAAHADEPLRTRLTARGGELAERAWTDLLRFESRDTARSVAILMREGTLDAYFRTNSIEPAPRPAGQFDFGSPEAFVGQKERILARLRTPVGIARVAGCLVRTVVGGRSRRPRAGVNDD